MTVRPLCANCGGYIHPGACPTPKAPRPRPGETDSETRNKPPKKEKK